MIDYKTIINYNTQSKIKKWNPTQPQRNSPCQTAQPADHLQRLTSGTRQASAPSWALSQHAPCPTQTPELCTAFAQQPICQDTDLVSAPLRKPATTKQCQTQHFATPGKTLSAEHYTKKLMCVCVCAHVCLWTGNRSIEPLEEPTLQPHDVCCEQVQWLWCELQPQQSVVHVCVSGNLGIQKGFVLQVLLQRESFGSQRIILPTIKFLDILQCQEELHRDEVFDVKSDHLMQICIDLPVSTENPLDRIHLPLVNCGEQWPEWWLAKV